MNTRKRAIGGAIVIGGLAGVCDGTTFFSIDKEADMLVTVNSVTNTVTPVGPIGYDFTRGVDLAVLDGVLYALDRVELRDGTYEAYLVAIDPATGAMLSVLQVRDDQGQRVSAEGLVSTDDELLASFGKALISTRIGVLSPLTGELSGDVDYADCACSAQCACSPDMDGLGYRASDQQLFSIDSQGDGFTKLFMTDLVPPRYEFVGEWDNPGPLDGAGDLAFSGARLFALAHLAGMLFEIDPATGQKLSMLTVSDPPVLEGLALACPADVNGDGTVNVLDLIDLLLCFGQPAAPLCEAEDLNGDGTVNVLDLIALLRTFGMTCP